MKLYNPCILCNSYIFLYALDTPHIYTIILILFIININIQAPLGCTINTGRSPLHPHHLQTINTKRQAGEGAKSNGYNCNTVRQAAPRHGPPQPYKGRAARRLSAAVKYFSEKRSNLGVDLRIFLGYTSCVDKAQQIKTRSTQKIMGLKKSDSEQFPAFQIGLLNLHFFTPRVQLIFITIFHSII